MGRKMDWRRPHLRKIALTVWMRNILVYRKLMGPMIALHFGDPLITLVGLGMGLGVFIGSIGDMPYLTFLASGFIASSTMMSASMEGIYAVFTRMVTQRTYESMLNTPIQVDDIVLGEALWCGTKGMMTSSAILLVAVLFGAVDSVLAVFAIPLGFLIGFAFCGLAMCVSALSPGYDFFNYYFTLFVTPMFILSGVFYPVETMPQIMQSIVGLLPLYHGVELVRPLVAGEIPDMIALHVGVLLGYGMIGHYMAVVLIRRRLIV